MRATTAMVFILLLLAVVFIVLNLDPATISFFGLARIRQPLGVVVSVAFLAGALVVYLLKAGVDIQHTWRDRHHKKTTKALAEASREYQAGLEAYLKEDVNAAREAFTRVLRQDPDHVGALLALGNLERDSGEVESAIQHHITANARNPGSVDILRALAEDYARDGRVEECIRALDDILALAPRDRSALKKKRDVFESAGRLEEAISAHQALVRSGVPDEGRLTILRLKAAQAAPSPEKSRAHLEAAIQHNKRCAAAYNLLGELAWQEDRASDAIKAWKSGWKATGDATLLQRLCFAYLVSGQSKQALKLCRQAMQARPEEALPALLYAVVALKLDAVGEAESALSSKALQNHPAAALLRLQLASSSADAEKLNLRAGEAVATLPSLSKPYRCSACGTGLDRWAPQCGSCGGWDSVQLATLDKSTLPFLGETEAPADRTSNEETPA